MARSMTKQREALRLLLTTQLTFRDIEAAAGLSKSAVGRYNRVAKSKRITWDEASHWTSAELDAALNKPPGGGKVLPSIDYATLIDEFASTKKSLMVWYVYYQKGAYPRYRSYSSIAKGLRAFRKTIPAQSTPEFLRARASSLSIPTRSTACCCQWRRLPA